SSRLADTDVQRRRRNAPWVFQELHPRMLPGVTGHDLARPVLAGPIDHQHFQPIFRIVVGDNGLQTGTNERLLVSTRDNDRYEGQDAVPSRTPLASGSLHSIHPHFTHETPSTTRPPRRACPTTASANANSPLST